MEYLGYEMGSIDNGKNTIDNTKDVTPEIQGEVLNVEKDPGRSGGK